MTQTHSSTGPRFRQQRPRELMERLKLGGLLLRRPANFAWYTNGGDNRVDHASPLGAADVLITLEAEYIFTNNIEALRMRKEQTPHFEVLEHPWYEDEAAAIRRVVGDTPLGSDFSLEGVLDVSGEVASLRYVLDPDAVEHYRKLGTDAVAAVTEAALSLEPGMSGREAAANLAAACRVEVSLAPCSWRPPTTASPATATPSRMARLSSGGPCS
jgi:Xaa-Pro dipeptidase